MTTIWFLLFNIGYSIFLGPPRAYEIQQTHRSSNGELSNLPFGVILFVESLVRAIVLIFLSTLLENIIGSFWYTWLMFDHWLFILLVAGTIHSAAYFYLFLSRTRHRKRSLGRVYRLLRNFCYALTPGIVCVVITLLIDGQRATPQSNGIQLLSIYIFTSSLFIIVGFFQAFIVKRRPSALGKIV